jgi:hypothetical protein
VMTATAGGTASHFFDFIVSLLIGKAATSQPR